MAKLTSLITTLCGLIAVSLFSVTPVFAASKYQIGATFFPMWNLTDVRNYPGWNQFAYPSCQKVYGRTGDQWCGVRDFFDGNTNGWNSDFSHLKPAIGYYDDSQPETFEKHIKQATQNGLSYFDFYFFWDVGRHQELQKTSMDAFLKAKNKNDIKFVFSTHFFATPNSEFEYITSNIVNKYFTESNYLTLPNGQPILILADTRKLGDNPGSAESVQAFMNLLTAKSMARLGKAPYIVGADCCTPRTLKYDGKGAGNVFSDSLANPTDSVGDYNRYISQIPSRQIPNTPSLFTLMANFDERPRTGIVWWLIRDKARYITNFTPQNFRSALIKEKQFMDARTDPLSKMLTIYAWNEWHEGGIIEPNARDGAQLLNIIGEVFELPKGTDPCRITGKCSAVSVPSPTIAPSPTSSAPLNKPGDLNSDSKVNIFDYNLLLTSFNKTGIPGFVAADINKSGRVDIFDYNIVLANYGK